MILRAYYAHGEPFPYSPRNFSDQANCCCPTRICQGCSLFEIKVYLLLDDQISKKKIFF
jgi:hypothetical protein